MLNWILILALFNFFSQSDAIDVEKAKKIIREHVRIYSAPDRTPLCTKWDCCNVTSTESCELKNLKQDTISLVLPGGNTRCIFSDSTPYAFQVIPGLTSNLLFYFQGGGACWDKASTTTTSMCTTDANPQSGGVFSRVDLENKFRQWTVVNVLYCSGDIHGGDVVRPYSDSQGYPVTQKGQNNVRATLNWVVQQQQNGGLDKQLNDVVVMGCSAGSIGAQLWGSTILREVSWKGGKAAVLPDSYAGVFPDGTQGPLVQGFGFCSFPSLTPSLKALCDSTSLTLQDINMAFISELAGMKAPISFIQSKTDIVQQSFYVAVGATTNASSVITPSQFYTDVNQIFGAYNSAFPLFLTYLVNGDQHCFTDSGTLFTADTLGPSDNNGPSNTLPTLSEYTSFFPLAPGEKVDTECSGTLKSHRITREFKLEGDEAGVGNTYCSSTLSPKSYTQN